MLKVPVENDNRPIHTVRHRSLKATIWRNQTEKGVLYNVIVTRSYRDKAPAAGRLLEYLNQIDKYRGTGK